MDLADAMALFTNDKAVVFIKGHVILCKAIGVRQDSSSTSNIKEVNSNFLSKISYKESAINTYFTGSKDRVEECARHRQVTTVRTTRRPQTTNTVASTGRTPTLGCRTCTHLYRFALSLFITS